MEGKQILIIDDDSISRKCLCNMAKKRNLVADSAENYNEGLEKYKADPGKYSLIMTDFNLDENDMTITAYKLITEMKAITGELTAKMIVMSGGKYS